MFKKASFSFWLPGKQYEKADAEVVAAWKKEQHTRLEEAFSDPNTVVLAEDEMVLTQATTTQKVWIPQGTYPDVIETNGTRKNRSIYGFLNLKTGKNTHFPQSARRCMKQRPYCQRSESSILHNKFYFYGMGLAGIAGASHRRHWSLIESKQYISPLRPTTQSPGTRLEKGASCSNPRSLHSQDRTRHKGIS